MVDTAGTVTDQYVYTPFGIEEPLTTTGNPFRYTGRRYDPESDLYYYRARYYDAVMGRFLEIDPIGYEDQMNMYAYVGNDPLNATDPSRLNCVSTEVTFVCDPPGDEIGEFTIPRPEGSPESIGTDQPYSHVYKAESSAPITSDEFFNDVVVEVVNDPTPGNDSPATPEGTVNDAGILPFPNSDNVLSFTVTDSNGNPVVVNLTIPGEHSLAPGIVSQGIRREGRETIITVVGEGNGVLSIPAQPIAKQVFQQKIDGDLRAAIFKDSQR